MLHLSQLLLALFILNSALTFQNRWPTVGVRWVPELSIELALLLLVLVLIAAWRGAPGRRLRCAVLVGYVILTLGRYLDVTAPALMGRSINLYWDSPHLPQVAALFLDQVAGWQVLLGGLALLALLTALVLVLRWALSTVIEALDHTPVRRALGVLALILLVPYGAGWLIPRLPVGHGFALPVTAMLAEQVKRVLAATVFRDHGRIAGQPPLPVSDLSRLGKGDVWVIFFESQGALVFDDPRFAIPLADDFATLERSLLAAGWQIASARVESSTFGGSSWLAHSSLLSGLRIADQDDYHDLLTSNRATLVSRFAAAGYRTVALMPGLRYAWPEGQFYRFDRIVDAERLEYHGPAYGGWVIPDQYSLYRLHQTEVTPTGRSPLLVFFPTINSHAPFAPLPPYHPDWSHVAAVSDATLSSGAVELSGRLDGEELAAAYVRSIRYNLAVLGGYLRQHAPANALLLVLGDHQPPAIVGGRDISWQVPVHVFSRDPAIISAFQAAGFQVGITPGSTALGGIEELGPLLLRTLDRPSATHAADAATSQPNGIHQK
ncbi:putative Sulfatase [Candidatus Contendobacter odensis Run_B_J11]|uniref:Sulfatase n=1 Tax=Candidatus Contendobacter odensis Run_B_J11 TaxID=1400861 RepID=A0A7U7GB32_9GAMM|nr:putative Sulfatase [Candidatus Contendobacter odensis Run_B_J11]